MQPISFPLQFGQQNLEIANLHKGLRLLLDKQIIQLSEQQQSLEEELANEEREQRYGDATAGLILTFQWQTAGLPAEDGRLVDEATARALNEALTQLGAFDQRVVKGKVYLADGSPVVGVIVRAFDRDLRRFESLGETTTDQVGYYEITYTRAQFIQSEKQNADLMITAIEPTPSGIVPLERPLANSPTLIDASADAVIDLVISSDVIPVPSEYERFIRTIEPLLAGTSLVDLREDEEDNPIEGKFQDINFLARETKINSEYIAFLVIAARLARSVDLYPEAFYGLFRQNLPTDLPALLAQGIKAHRQALQVSLQSNIIPAQFGNELENILGRLQALEVQQPTFLIQPELLYSNLTDLENLKSEQSSFVVSKLNQHLQNEIVKAIATTSEAMTTAVKAAVQHVDYQQAQDSLLSTVIQESILPILKRNQALAEEVKSVEKRIAETPSQPVKDLLHLDKSLQENPIFSQDILRVKTQEYARLSELDNESTKTLIAKNLYLDDVTEDVLSGLVSEGVLNEQTKNNLQLTIELGRLTNDNLPLVRALKTENLKTTDFTFWRKADWQQLVTSAQVPAPAGETIESYVDKIVFNIEQTFPSQVLINRILDAQLDTQFNRLDSLSSLLNHNDKLIDGGTPAEMDWQSVDPEMRQTLQTELEKLTTFANHYRHLGVTDLINDKASDLDQKKQAIATRVDLLNVFHANNPNLDLRLVNFLDLQATRIDWEGISETEQPLVRKQLMAYQRVLNLTDTVADSQVLLNRGYDSTLAIATDTEENFVHNSGLPLGKARQTYAKSQENSLYISHQVEMIRDIVQGNFKHFAVANLDPAIVNDLQKVDGFENLFGKQNYCDCEACSSVLSPAAYFVDLMSFIEKHVSKPVFVDTKQTTHPLYLKNRRPDLWTLALSCENTDTLIPYLTIVNEVLENYLKRTLSQDVFGQFSQKSENVSFALPFNLPLEELRLYLSHFGITLHQIYKTLKQSDLTIWRSRLNLSQEEVEVITEPDPANVKYRFDNRESLVDFDVQEFIQLAGISRSQLDELLALRFNPDLNKITVEQKYETGDLQQTSEVLKQLTVDRLDYTHRFIRLWKRTSWSITELDLVLSILAPKQANGTIQSSELSQKLVLELAQLVDIQEALNLTVEELCSMVDHLPTSTAASQTVVSRGDRNFFERLFDTQKLFGVTGTEPLTFHHYSLNKRNSGDTVVDPRTPVLLGGLGISETELLLLFQLLKDEMPFDENGDCTLNPSNIFLLYRHARLARALRLSIEDFITVLRLLFEPSQHVVKTLSQIHKLVQVENWLKSCPFKVSELRFILIGEESTAVKFRVDSSAAGKLMQEVQASSAPNKTEALRTALAILFNLTQDQLTKILQWVRIPERISDVSSLLTLVQQIERVLLLLDNLKFKEKTVAYLTQSASALGIADLKNLTLGTVQSLDFYKNLITLSDEAEQQVQTVLDHYMTSTAFSTGDGSDAAILADLWKQDKSLVESLIKSLSLPNVSIKALGHLWECLKLCQILGINGFSLQTLAKNANYNELIAARDVALGSFSSKYDDEKVRREKLEPYQDRINVKKRDVLCNYIIARRVDLKFQDLRNIYAFFLLDVEMSGCFRTSRLVCAISSLQLYIHRCLVNLEQSDPLLNPRVVNIKVDPTRIPAQQWEWRKNYRVWEANRKVFLYPENYIEPDLRDNKTPIFKELEDELLQQKITQESAETAYKKYVSQFAELARLRIAGSYYHDASRTYYFFSRTSQDPPQYYYRKWINNEVWTPWEKIELGINSDRVSAVVHQGKVYLFWVEIKSKEIVSIQEGTSKSEGFEYSAEFLFSYQNEGKKWLPVQRLAINEKDETVKNLFFGQASKKISPNKSCFLTVNNNKLYLLYYEPNFSANSNKVAARARVDLFNNLIKPPDRIVELGVPNDKLLKLFLLGITVELLTYRGTHFYDEASLDHELIADDQSQGTAIARSTEKQLSSNLHLVSHKPGDFVWTVDDQQYLIRYLNLKILSFQIRRDFIRISTSLSSRLGELLFVEGLETFLSINTQKQAENPFEFQSRNPFELMSLVDEPEHINFKGAYGSYYQELFLHIPFTIANHLNANHKFKEAKWWYERIFDPTANESPDDKKPTDRNWRYLEFRNLTIQKMKDILTDKAVVAQYNEDPFNPHAIARLRLSAYQKAIVMKYIDNLLDWGDHLFAQDTMESINEATMLYVLAYDILGKRPAKLGKCKIEDDRTRTYERISTKGIGDSEFLVELDNSSYSDRVAVQIDKAKLARDLVAGANENILVASRSGATTSENLSTATSNASILVTQPLLASYSTVATVTKHLEEDAKKWETAKPIPMNPALELVKQSISVFCVPPNHNLLGYWDRVEDRLFKIRNCMNISGIRRQLALFQPEIEPMFLVRAKAAGLSLEEFSPHSPLPHYRFSYLIEKAKQFTQTVQSFGSALLSALEKKDVEELTLLRSVHERNVLQLTKDIKKQQIREAQYQYQAMVQTKINVQNRVNHYQDLIVKGLIGCEITQQDSKQTGTTYKRKEGINRTLAAIFYLIPQLGSPFAMKFGGKEQGDSTKAWADWFSSMASVADAISTSAGLEATFQRREQEWKQQLLLAQQEMEQVKQQQLAAEVRQLIAEKDLKIHERNMEQVEELHDFYKNKFTSLGLYNYLSTNLNRLYREAYNIAHDMAKMAENAYKFERDDDTIFIAGDNWHFDRAGLLAGERLLLQLQRMEKIYLEQHKRDYEITQSFSLALLSPSALIDLKQTGSCNFEIPEIMFDLFYPGQFKRLIKSVRLTIPCVTGPYTNVSAKLTLQQSWVRASNKLNTNSLDKNGDQLKVGQGTSISASSAQNDAGMFELNFRDERYLPFEGAGAISAWKLELPSTLRQFNYDTISDVIIHVSYTAKDSVTFRIDVEKQIAATLTSYAKDPGLFRLVSLKHEFPTAFHQLLHSSSATQATEFELTEQYFPYFLIDKTLTLASPVKVYLKPQDKKTVTTPELMKINDVDVNFIKDGKKLQEPNVSLLGNPIRKWTVSARANSLNREEIDDILLLLQYSAS
ncbi:MULTISPECIES: neuraminidase-like domain-containing protein [Cyanophyceae]|uniref:Neuraminidase-like domain-containing protein n=1 Tax=Leptolyngbya subtilissima DQ-A4 TaxID=2933933 RepID=A0ABV0KA43_9CYAN|nr:neuraminidase-like domain-containing protein [Nodosilinea sp. FACHB-141]MBD2114975.1 hypothetical protein [Nodosilinea sp. FACHB-141]